MKISQTIRREHGATMDSVEAAGTEAEEGMRRKSEEFAASGNRVYLPLAD